MKFFLVKQGLLGLSVIGVLTFGAGCGNTIYGLGMDMERAGQRLQGNREPTSEAPAEGYYSQPANPAQPSYPSYPSYPSGSSY